MDRNSFVQAGHRTRNAVVLAAGDALALFVALWIGRFVVHCLFDDVLSVRYSILIIPVWWVGAILVGLLPGWGLGDVEELRRTELLTLSVFAAGGVIYFFLPKYFSPSRVAYVISLATAMIGLPATRIVVKSLLARARVWGCPAVVYGSTEAVGDVVRAFSDHHTAGYRPVGVYIDSNPAPLSVEGLPVLGGFYDATHLAPAALVCIGPSDHDFAAHFDRTLKGYQHVVLLPRIGIDFFQFVTPRSMAGLVGLEVTRNLLNPGAHETKRIMDLLVATVMIPLWLPLLGLVAAGIAIIDGQPVFYRQRRMGRHGREICLLKFKTMVVDADKALAKALDEDEALQREWNSNRKLRNDPRITPLGAFLRRWSLDELPQLLHVLRGEMSLVGPRPLPDYHRADLHPDTQQLREQVRPGMTGLWQVSGRSDTGNEGLDKWDRFYVRNWSIWLDLVILVRTIGAVCRRKGAY